MPRGLEAVAAEVIGEDLDDRTAAGLWPSDHAEINRHAAPGVPIAGERSGRFSASAAGTIRLLNILERQLPPEELPHDMYTEVLNVFALAEVSKHRCTDGPPIAPRRRYRGPSPPAVDRDLYGSRAAAAAGLRHSADLS